MILKCELHLKRGNIRWKTFFMTFTRYMEHIAMYVKTNFNLPSKDKNQKL